MVHIREYCKGRKRSIFLDRDELAWLVRILEDLVRVEDSRIFSNQSLQGFPRVLAQHCFNRHSGFLVVEVIQLSSWKVKLVKVGSFLAQS